MTATCSIPNCGKSCPVDEPFCAAHRDNYVPLSAAIARAHADLYLDAVARAETAEASLSKVTTQLDRLMEACKPFVEVLNFDVGVDEADDDTFQPMKSGYNRAPRPTVGHFRALRSAYNASKGAAS